MKVFFVKVMTQQGIAQYDVSDIFSPFPLRNRLYNILQILKRIGSAIVPPLQ